MENPEEVLQSLDEFAKLKPKDIPRELEDYLSYVAKTGDPVYQWSLVKCLFREKLLNVMTDFYETCPTIDLPPCPNVDPFNYETMKTSLLERIDSFASAPFTVQRLCELLTTPRKEYSRVDKYIRAIEKNILVVSTREPGNIRRSDVMQPDFLMNGVMEGRGLDIGEAIETVSSDSVTLIHADDNEVNVTDSIPVDCSSADEIDMEDHSDIENTNENVLDKQDKTTSPVRVESTKNNGDSGEPNEVSELKSKPVDNNSACGSELKEQESISILAETVSEPIPSEPKDLDAEKSTSKPTIAVISESKDSSDNSSESKPDVVSEEEEEVQGADTNNISEDKDVEINVTSSVVESAVPDSVEEPSLTDSVTEPVLEESVSEETTEANLIVEATEENKDQFETLNIVVVAPNTSSKLDEEDNTEENPCKGSLLDTDSSQSVSPNLVNNTSVEVTSAAEVVSDSDEVIGELSPIEGLEEVTSNISSESKDEISSVESVQNVELSKVVTEDTDTKDSDTSEFNSQDEEDNKDITVNEILISEESNLTMEAEQDERMEVDDVSNQSPEEAMLAEEGEEPMDQSEEQPT